MRSVDMCEACARKFLDMAQMVKGDIALHDALSPTPTGFPVGEFKEMCRRWDGSVVKSEDYDSSQKDVLLQKVSEPSGL